MKLIIVIISLLFLSGCASNPYVDSSQGNTFIVDSSEEYYVINDTSIDDRSLQPSISQVKNMEEQLHNNCQNALPDGWEEWKSEFIVGDNYQGLFSWVIKLSGSNMSHSQLWYTDISNGSRKVYDLECSYGMMDSFELYNLSVVIIQTGEVGFDFWYVDNGVPTHQTGGSTRDLMYDKDRNLIIGYSAGVYAKEYYYGYIKLANDKFLFYEYGGYKGDDKIFLAYDNSQIILDDFYSKGYNISDFIYRENGVISLNATAKDNTCWSFNYFVEDNQLVLISKAASPYLIPYSRDYSLTIYPYGKEPWYYSCDA